jgi:hypothetical protein
MKTFMVDCGLLVSGGLSGVGSSIASSGDPPKNRSRIKARMIFNRYGFMFLVHGFLKAPKS